MGLGDSGASGASVSAEGDMKDVPGDGKGEAEGTDTSVWGLLCPSLVGAEDGLWS